MKKINEITEIMKLYAQNPQKGFEQIYKTYSGPLFRYLRSSFSLNKSEAEDILHSAFLPWVKDPSKCAQIDNPAAYMYTSVRNAAFKLKMKKAKECVCSEPEVSVSHDKLVENRLIIAKALESLPQEQRETIVLKLWSDMTFEEIAQVQQCTLATAASRYRYAIAKLKELIT